MALDEHPGMFGAAVLHPEPRPTSSLVELRTDSVLSTTGFATIRMRLGHNCCLHRQTSTKFH